MYFEFREISTDEMFRCYGDDQRVIHISSGDVSQNFSGCDFSEILKASVGDTFNIKEGVASPHFEDGYEYLIITKAE